MKNITQWQHFKKNYLVVSILLTGVFILTLIMSLFRYDELWYFSFFFLFLAWVVLPIGNYFSWRTKR